MPRPRRSDAFVNNEQLLAALRECRHSVEMAMARAKIGGPLYDASGNLLVAIDAVAFVLTGRTDLLHAQPHGRR